MDVYITDWGLQTFLELKNQRVFTANEYSLTIRPDAVKVKLYPNDPKFQNNIGWGPAKEIGGVNVQHGFKLKWHNIGSGNIQLRVGVAIINSEAFLCRGYVKKSNAVDKREIARLKTHINRISKGNYKWMGKI